MSVIPELHLRSHKKMVVKFTTISTTILKKSSYPVACYKLLQPMSCVMLELMCGMITTRK